MSDVINVKKIRRNKDMSNVISLKHVKEIRGNNMGKGCPTIVHCGVEPLTVTSFYCNGFDDSDFVL